MLDDGIILVLVVLLLLVLVILVVCFVLVCFFLVKFDGVVVWWVVSEDVEGEV